MNDILNLGIITKSEKVLVSSRIIAEKFDREHSHVLRTIYSLTESTSGLSKEFTNNNFIVSSYKDDSGKMNKEYLLTKDGFTMVVMEFKTKKSREFKEAYIKQFNQMESIIREKNSTEWKETRIKGKLARRNETDIILTKLIPLAELQGSKNSGKLYMVYTKLINDCLGIPSNSREKATRRILDVIYSLENLIEHVIEEEANKGTYYKDIYQICKGKCKLLIELSYLPQQKLIA